MDSLDEAEVNYETLGSNPKVRRNVKIWDRRFIKALHVFIFNRSGGSDRRERILAFSGFSYGSSDDSYREKEELLSQRLFMSDLAAICAILEIEAESKNLIKYIFHHLLSGSLLKYTPPDELDNPDEAEGEGEGDNDNESYIDVGEERANMDEDEKDLPPKLYNPIFKHILDFVRPFRGCNDYSIECWMRDFEDAASALHLKEWQKFVLARNSLKGLAKSLIEEKRITKWKELKPVLMNEFKSRMSDKVLHEALKKRKKKANESAMDYYRDMRTIAKEGMLGDLDLMEYIIDGTPDDPWKFVLYGAASMSHFRQKLKDYDYLAKKNQRSPEPPAPRIRGESSGSRMKASRSTGVPDQNGSDKPESTPIENGDLACSKCYNYGDGSNVSESELEGLRFVRENFNGLPKKEVFLKGKRLYAMIDSGSQLNLINTASYRRIGSPSLKETILFLRGFGKAKVPPEGYFEEVVQIDGYNFNTRFYVVGDDVLKRDVIIGSTLLQQAEFTFRRNEILIRKIEDPEQCSTSSSAKNAAGRSPLECKQCVSLISGPSTSRKSQECAICDEGCSQDYSFPMLLDEDETMMSDFQNAVRIENEKTMEYLRKVGCQDDYFKKKEVVSNPVTEKPTDKGEISKVTESNTKVKTEQIKRVIFVEEDKKEYDCKVTQGEVESMEELQRKCSIMEKSLIELTKDCNRLRKENKTFLNMLSEEKFKHKKLSDKIRDCRLPKKL